MTLASQYEVRSSQNDCHGMIVGQSDWHGIMSYDYADRRYEWITWARGAKIQRLHNVIDSTRRDNHCLFYITRLSAKEAKEVGL